jgi:hypothetical protein
MLSQVIKSLVMVSTAQPNVVAKENGRGRRFSAQLATRKSGKRQEILAELKAKNCFAVNRVRLNGAMISSLVKIMPTGEAENIFTKTSY